LDRPALAPDPPLGSDADEPLADRACTATGLPPGLTISTEGRISGLIGQPGCNTVTITTDDGASAPRTVTFTWIVL
jgi:beta-glucosidase